MRDICRLGRHCKAPVLPQSLTNLLQYTSEAIRNSGDKAVDRSPDGIHTINHQVERTFRNISESTEGISEGFFDILPRFFPVALEHIRNKVYEIVNCSEKLLHCVFYSCENIGKCLFQLFKNSLEIPRIVVDKLIKNRLEHIVPERINDLLPELCQRFTDLLENRSYAVVPCRL